MGDGHVGRTAEHGGQRLLGLHLLQVELHVRCGAGQLGPRSGHDGGRGGGERGQRDPSGDLVTQRGQISLGRLELGQEGVGVGHEEAGRGGQPDAPAGPLGQLHPDLPFEGGELLGNGRGRVAQRGGGRGDRSVGADSMQDPEAAHIQHEAELISHP